MKGCGTLLMIYDMTLVDLMYEKGHLADDMEWPSRHVSILIIDPGDKLGKPIGRELSPIGRCSYGKMGVLGHGGTAIGSRRFGRVFFSWIDTPAFARLMAIEGQQAYTATSGYFHLSCILFVCTMICSL